MIFARPDGWWTIHSPNLGPRQELWEAHDNELSRLLKASEINKEAYAC